MKYHNDEALVNGIIRQKVPWLGFELYSSFGEHMRKHYLCLSLHSSRSCAQEIDGLYEMHPEVEDWAFSSGLISLIYSVITFALITPFPIPPQPQ